MRMTKQAAVLAFVVVLLLSGCRRINPGPEYNPTPVILDLADHFPSMPLSADNPLTEEGVLLGRHLYYDPLLHPEQSMACASCHFQSNAFSSWPTSSCSSVIPHMNMGWSSSFLWDGSIEGTLEDAMVFEVEDFFGTDVNLLQADAAYPLMYFEAFGDSVITTDLTAKALAQFLRTLVTDQSPFDAYYYDHTTQLTTQELEGLILFNSEKGDCFHCHPPPMFTDYQFHNTGLDSTFTSDPGRYAVTGEPQDLGSFKTPSLRNIELTAPYMHDGRFLTLEQVVSHYHHGVMPSASLDPLMTKLNGMTNLSLTQQEQASLVSFLKTLTDTDFTNNPAFSQP